MSVEKLRLCFEDGSEVAAHFNPANMSIKPDATSQPQPSTGKAAPSESIYVAGDAATMSLDLLFDTTDVGTAVTELTGRLDKLVEIYKGTGRPQWVKLISGKVPDFAWIAKNLSVDFNYFDAKGTPLRAKVKTSLTQFNDRAQKSKTNSTSGPPRPQKLHTVLEGETLERIAVLHYGDSAKWRMLADANRNAVKDPMSLRPGTVLVVPDRRGRNND